MIPSNNLDAISTRLRESPLRLHNTLCRADELMETRTRAEAALRAAAAGAREGQAMLVAMLLARRHHHVRS